MKNETGTMVEELKLLIDNYTMEAVSRGLANIALERAERALNNRPDEALANRWEAIARNLQRAADEATLWVGTIGEKIQQRK